MNRRTLIKSISYCGLCALGGRLGWRLSEQTWRAGYEIPPIPERPESAPVDPIADEGSGMREPPEPDVPMTEQASYLEKIRDFDRPYDDDFVLDPERFELLRTTAKHLSRVQRVYGHGHFNLLSFDSMIKVSRRYGKIGDFTAEELTFLEEIFARDAVEYGFYGDKVMAEMTAQVPDSEVVKVNGTGHYLFRGEPEQKYEQMRLDLEDQVFLTSGIRGVVKQLQLFLDKAVTTEGNLAQASRSLAPPGYSYHAIGDFDIGKVGFGLDNFNEAFAETDEYKRLVDLGYAEIRYTPTNPYGVRHEPWHIKMAT